MCPCKLASFAPPFQYPSVISFLFISLQYYIIQSYNSRIRRQLKLQTNNNIFRDCLNTALTEDFAFIKRVCREIADSR